MTFHPNQPVQFLANPDSHEDMDWRYTEIEDVLDKQVTIPCWPWFLAKSDYGSLWK